jgi:hypothetical protein
MAEKNRKQNEYQDVTPQGRPEIGYNPGKKKDLQQEKGGNQG